MKAFLFLFLTHQLLLLISCSNEQEKIREKETKEWLEISEDLDAEVNNRIYSIKTKLSEPISFLHLAENDRKKVYQNFNIFDSSFTSINTVINELKEIYYSKSSPMIKGGKVREHYFSLSENGKALYPSIINTLNHHKSFKGVNDVNFENYRFRIIPEILHDKNYFEKEFKDISLPIALTKLTKLKEELLQLFYFSSERKLEALLSDPKPGCVGALPVIASTTDCMKVGEEQEIQIFLAFFAATPYMEMYSTKLSDTSVKSTNDNFQEVKIQNGRGSVKVKAIEVGRKQITGKIKYLNPAGNETELYFRKEITVIR